MDKAWLVTETRSAIDRYYKRYRAACNCKDVDGKELSESTAGKIRTTCKLYKGIATALEELLDIYPSDVVDLSDEAMYGIMRIVEPNERHKGLIYEQHNA